jgi:hypothetical protein
VSNIAFRRAPHKPHKWILESTKRAREDEYRELERDKVWAAGKAAATAATERLPVSASPDS